jgi:hypothetical protein
MPRRGWIATALLAAMCLGGITTLVSQAGYSDALDRELRGPRASLDPSEHSGRTVGDFSKEGLHAGAEIQTSVSEDRPSEDGKILRLR